jgi:hypothetical protein
MESKFSEIVTNETQLREIEEMQALIDESYRERLY